jgi:enoyl-CoA hydratase/carnithine racemase
MPGGDLKVLGTVRAHEEAVGMAQPVRRALDLAALAMLATGELYDAAAAQVLGLVEAVAPRSAFDQEWRALSARMAALAPGERPDGSG